MAPWFDPDESARKTWAGSEPLEDVVRGEENLKSVVERAVATRLPYRSSVEATLEPPLAAAELETDEFTHAKLQFRCGVQADGTVKLLARGHMWSKGGRHRRFRAQFRRQAAPEDLRPFETYTVWRRYQYGTVHWRDDGTIRFEPEEDANGESLQTVPWEELVSPIQVRLAELELIRNPALAVNILDARDEWRDYADQFRYDPEAFEVGP